MDDRLDVVDAETGVEEDTALCTDEEVRMQFHPLTVLCDGIRRGIDFLDGEPRLSVRIRFGL